MSKRTRYAWLSGLAALSIAFSASAYNQPAVNLGFTSFLDGTPPAGSGLYFAQYVQYYTSHNLPDLPFSGDPELEAWISLSQIICQSDPVLPGGASLGLDVILPAAAFDVKADGTPLTTQDGLGDLLMGPYLQWSPVMGANGPVFVHRIELQTILPTGEYNRNRSINPGANVVSLNPYWAATWFVSPKWTVSWRLHYLWNDKNEAPNIQDIDTLQDGSAVHADFATEVEVIENHLRLGLNGYALKQLENDKMDGTRVDGTKEQVIAIGPGAMWSFSREDHLFFNVYFETAAENRPEGQRFNLRYVHHF